MAYSELVGAFTQQQNEEKIKSKANGQMAYWTKQEKTIAIEAAWLVCMCM